MKILALSDQVISHVYSEQIRDYYGDVDMVIGCGDLPYYYLEYIATVLPAPVVYVHGNHDKPIHTADGRTMLEPGGCFSLEDRVMTVKGLIMAGLGGSIRYKPGAPHQYSESEMRGRIMGLIPRLTINRLLHGRALDILVAHSPPFGIHDGADLPHTGFKTFLTLMRYFKPAYLLHGHKHRHRRDLIEETMYDETMVINVYPKYVLELETVENDSNGQSQLI